MEPPGAGSGEDYGDGSPVESRLVSPPAPSDESKSTGSPGSLSGSEDSQSGVKDHGEGHPDVTPSLFSSDNKNTEDQDTLIDPESSPSAGQDLSERTQETAVVETLPNQNKIPDSPDTIRSSESLTSAGSEEDYNGGSPVRSILVPPPAPSEESKSSQSGSEGLQTDASVKDYSEKQPDFMSTPVLYDNTNIEGEGTSMGPESSSSDASVKDHSERHLDRMTIPALDDITSIEGQGTSMTPEGSPSAENEDQEEHFNIRPSNATYTNKGMYNWMFVVLVPLIAYLVYMSQLENSRHEAETSVQTFLRNLEKVERSFQSQPDQLWKRSRIMLQKHVNTTTHSEPSILMFAAALDAEKTLRCLSRSIAGAYASALGSTAVEIDGSGKNLLDSDKVKMELDQRLSSEFNEGKKAAVIHHFQDLPPPSTLLFYKYCDHENAAFKDVSLLITVLLPEERLEPDLSLSALEEKVFDFLVVKFSVSNIPGQYNALDADKLSGLWSRLSHVILPVRPEKEIEKSGCEDE
uniref:Torsin-1A-interacting protein 2-like n=1 Tax=Callorhinchus milii TaxID=7868 RepID=A0A4W3H303_CALMI|eukprot:gi/632969645/ref/XP_007901193.1/ PREDICTED: torsin-1A-interacting protein 2-like [Callorhinchus milii]